MKRRRTSASLIALTLTSLLVATVVAPAVAQTNGSADESNEPTVEMIRGKRLKFGKTRVGDWVAIRDAEADVRTPDGVLYPDAQGWGDITRVLITESRLTGKLATEWERGFPVGAADTYRGEQTVIEKKRPYIFLIVETGGNVPRDGDATMQLVVGASGPDSKPLSPMSGIDLTNGRSQFSRSGLFTGGQLGSGTTDQTDLALGETAELYNGKSRDFGRFERKTKRIYHAAWVPSDSTHLTVALETTQDGMQLIDELELPIGTTRLELGDPYFGIVKDADPLVCVDLRTRSTPVALAADAESIDAIWLEANVEVADDFDLAALAGRSDEIELVPGAGTAEPVRLAAVWEVDEGSRSATIRAALPEGVDSWRLDLDGSPSDGSRGDGSGTEGGVRAFLQAEVDPPREAVLSDVSFRRALWAVLGSSAFEVSPGVVGRLGPQGCARFEFAQVACDVADDVGIDAMLGPLPDGVVGRQVTTAEGFDICVAGAPDAAASYIFARRDEPFSQQEFMSRAQANACPASPLEGSESMLILDCAAEGFESLWAHFVPGEAPDADGFIVSLDVVVADEGDLDWGSVGRDLAAAFAADPNSWLPGPDAVDPETVDPEAVEPAAPDA